MAVSWEGIPGHRIIDEYGRGMGADAYGLVVTCLCGEVMSAIAPTKRKARKRARAKYRAHLSGKVML
jgi:hypothetical protein